jgi:predicted alpha-1,6-mannanase (GH76 family)
MTTNERINKDRGFLIAAVSLNLKQCIDIMSPDYFDTWGYAHYYDLVVDIVDEMMSGTEYIKYLSNCNHFHEMSTSIDTYYEDMARGMVTHDRIKRVAGLN